ncbi:MAG: aminoglycoside phosphotransferase family protein [Actinobacteria bacterium]|nr:aminoglycoside phosphotransferase family protein [Actinomycetota bacterium]
MDDLDTKPWLGTDRDAVFRGLLAAYGTAVELRASGSAFVVAPEAASCGAPAERLDDRHSLSVFGYVDGEPGRWGRSLMRTGLNEVVEMLAKLHSHPATTPGVARRWFAIPGRAELDSAMADLDVVWDGGPLSEAARRDLTTHTRLIERWLAHLDRFTARLSERGNATVLTHGEPHPGNLILTKAGLVLVDWDSVALAPPERDLWMFDGMGDAVFTHYQTLTGITPDRDAVSAYRLLWALADAAAFVVQLRREPRDEPDAHKALDSLRSIFERRAPSPYNVIGCPWSTQGCGGHQPMRRMA